MESLTNRRMFLRRSGLAVVGGSLILTGWGDADAAAPGEPTAPARLTRASAKATSLAVGANLGEVHVQFSWILDIGWSGFYVADREGYWDEERLEVVLQPGGPQGPFAEETIAGGSADLGTTTSLANVVNGIQSGTNFRVIGSQLQRSPAMLLSLEENPVRTLEDLVGKRVGSTPAYESRLKGILEAAGLPPEITIVPIGSDASGLVAGDVDVMVAFLGNEDLQLEQEGIPHVSVMFEDLGLPDYVNMIITTQEVIDARREALVAFMRGVVKGYERVIADSELGIRLTVDDYGAELGLDEEQQRGAINAMVSLMQSDLTAEQGLFQMDVEFVAGPIYDGFAAYGLTGLPAPDTYIDMSILADAMGGEATLLD